MKYFDQLFHVWSHPNINVSYEVWQKGHAQKMGRAVHTPRKFLEQLSPQI